MTKPMPIGPVMLDIEGLTLTSYDIEKIQHPNTGAVIFFARNYADPEQISSLCQSIRAVRNGTILIAVDQEGGRVQRFQNGFTRLPPANRYADTPELVEAAGWLMAVELLAVGVDFSFAPVLDVDCGISTVIGDRSFSQHANTATQLASHFYQGMRKAGMAATGKHFPGHGGVAVDSHLALPEDHRSLEELLNKDLLPFKQLIADGLEAIMPAHVVYSAIDPNPAGFSAFWIQDVLRQQLQFNGTVFSDDLNMEGASIAGSHSDRALQAQQAGCDMLLVCNNPLAAEQVLESLPITYDPTRETRLLSMRGKSSLGRAELLQDVLWQTIAQQIAKLSA